MAGGDTLPLEKSEKKSEKNLEKFQPVLNMRA
jgi:hypothetical protein